MTNKLVRVSGWVVCASVVAAPLVVWLISIGNPFDYFAYRLPPGQAAYVASKLGGLVAFSLLWLQCLLALARTAPVLRSFPASTRVVHKWLGMAMAAVALAHFLLFFVAVWLRNGAPAWGLLIPRFDHGYFDLYVSLGLIALVLLACGMLAGWQLMRGRKAWRLLHYVWPVVFGLVFLHAFAIGSESRFGAMRYVFLFMATSLAAAAISRAHVEYKRRRGLSELNGGRHARTAGR